MSLKFETCFEKMKTIIVHLFQVYFNFGCLLHKHAWIIHLQYISEKLNKSKLTIVRDVLALHVSLTIQVQALSAACDELVVNLHALMQFQCVTIISRI